MFPTETKTDMGLARPSALRREIVEGAGTPEANGVYQTYCDCQRVCVLLPPQD